MIGLLRGPVVLRTGEGEVILDVAGRRLPGGGHALRRPPR